ncbi:heavy metal transport/detoxification superfamily protein isoform X2 [Tasmannia lanceolata]|uniref:heavy metal transport/detoxification superfamily protein isoform X2 n=1 Tax=Tasmannia lanceolata TaxID=3420 RepID=UPI0040633544
MAAIPAFSSPYLICRSNSHGLLAASSSSSSTPLPFLHFQKSVVYRSKFLIRKRFPVLNEIRAVAEEETLISEEETLISEEETETPVSVPVSPSDLLTMFFKAEGTMSESAISAVTKALEDQEGVSDLNVHVLEGIASVEFTKQTTVQATGVASNLVEIIQGSGFKLQALNLSFEDEEDANN